MTDSTIATIVKVYNVYAKNPEDCTYQIAIWSVVETGLGITASSLFTLRPLFRWLRGERLSYDRHTGGAARAYNECQLASLNKDGLKESSPRDVNPKSLTGNTTDVMNPVTFRPLGGFIPSITSERDLYFEICPITPVNRVVVQTSFRQTISERST